MKERKLLIVQPDWLPLQVSHVTASGSPQTRVQPNKGRQLMNNRGPLLSDSDRLLFLSDDIFHRSSKGT